MALETAKELFTKMTNDIKDSIRDESVPTQDSAALPWKTVDLDPERTHEVTKLVRNEPAIEPIKCESFEEIGTPAQIAELYGALAIAKLGFEEIKRTETVKITSEKAKYDFDYAPLEVMLAACTKALSQAGVVVLMPFGMQRVPAADNDGFVKMCMQRIIVAHKLGGRIQALFWFSPHDDMKIFGGQTTYAQRYMYRSLLGVGGGADMDSQPLSMGQLEGSAQSRDRRNDSQGGQQSQQRTQGNTPADNRPQGQPKNQVTRHAPGPSQTESPTNRPASTAPATTGPTTPPTTTEPKSTPVAQEQSANGAPASSGNASSASLASTGVTTGKASHKSCEEMQVKLKSLGYNTLALASNRILQSTNPRLVNIGKAPFGSELSQADVDLVLMDLISEATDKAIKDGAKQ